MIYIGKQNLVSSCAPALQLFVVAVSNVDIHIARFTFSRKERQEK